MSVDGSVTFVDVHNDAVGASSGRDSGRAVTVVRLSVGASTTPPRLLDDPDAVDLPLPLKRAADRIVVLALGAAGRDVGQLVAVVVGRAEEVLGQRVEDVDAVDAVVGADRDVHRHQFVEVRRRDAQRLLERVDELAQLIERDVLRRLLVESLPHLVVHVEVVLRQTLLHVLRRLKSASTSLKISPIRD